MDFDNRRLLQERFSEYGCTVLNYTDEKILVDYFYSEEMYEKYLLGSNCRQGMGMHDKNQILEFNRIPDNHMVVVQNNGEEIAKYKFSSIVKGVLTYKNIGKDLKAKNKSLTFWIRENKFDGKLNYINTEGVSLDFIDINAIKEYLHQNYGEYTLVDWSVLIE